MESTSGPTGADPAPAEAPVTPAPEAAEVDAPADPVISPATFTGSGGEYFRIWIVNVALTILTLGIFSAWAKVRRLQYFYRHTHLAGASFDFHGSPFAILKGRIIGAVLFAGYTLAGTISPLAALAAMGVVGCLMPWMLARSFRFRLANTSHRGLHFRFTGTVRTAYWVMLGLPVFSILSFGLLAPFCHQRIKRYQFDHAWFGNARFRTAVQAQAFYVTYIGAVMIGFVAIGAFVALVGGITAGAGAAEAAGGDVAPSPAAISILIGAAFLIYLVGLLAVQSLVRTRVRNDVWNATTVQACSFASTLRVRSVLAISLTNLVATIGTLGLFWPFAQVRMAKYLIGGLSLRGEPDFAAIASTFTPGETAVGDEVAGLFDFDIAF